MIIEAFVKKVKGGYKVVKEGGGGAFSKKPLSKEKAEAQLRAIEANKHGTARGVSRKLKRAR